MMIYLYSRKRHALQLRVLSILTNPYKSNTFNKFKILKIQFWRILIHQSLNKFKILQKKLTSILGASAIVLPGSWLGWALCSSSHGLLSTSSTSSTFWLRPAKILEHRFFLFLLISWVKIYCFFGSLIERNLISGDNVDLLHNIPLLCHELCLLQPNHVSWSLSLSVLLHTSILVDKYNQPNHVSWSLSLSEFVSDCCILAR